MAAKALPAQDVLHQLLSYDPETGKLFWKERGPNWFKAGRQTAEHNAAIWNGKNAGKEACSVSVSGYLETSIFRRRVLAHRIIWKMVYGTEPDTIDHLNGDKSDNRIKNLRSISQTLNSRNQALRKNNTSGVLGVRWEARLHKWHSRINVNRKTVHLGVYASFEEAVAARKAAEREYGFHPNHGRAA